MMAAVLALATAAYAYSALGGTVSLWPVALRGLVVPVLWLAYALYTVRVTTERLQHLERARMALELAREEEQEQAAVKREE